MGTECAVRTFNMPALETIRNNPSEMRSANIARIFDRQENLDELARILRREAGDAEAVLLPDEKEEGVAVVDVGGGVTDVTVYYRNVVRYVASIPMGASAINRDIRTMSVPEKHVESLKQKYGSAVAELAPEDKLIRVNGRTAREAKDILLRNLATVIEARATDIAEFVQQEIKDSGYAGKLAYGIVLTGGSAKQQSIDIFVTSCKILAFRGLLQIIIIAFHQTGNIP
jgi:cell division protein FtsA